MKLTRHSKFIRFSIVLTGLLCLCHSAFASGLTNDSRKRSPLTTKGDLYAFSTGNGRFPVGSMGQILSVDTGATFGIKWVDASAGAGTVTNSGTLTSNAVIIGAGTTVVQAITADATARHALFSTATSPAFSQITSNDVSGVLGSSAGGTGRSSYTLGDLLQGTSTGLNRVSVGAMGQILSSDTVAGIKWVTGITSPDVNAGVFSEARGGTGRGTYTKGDILGGSGTNVLGALPIGSMGQILSVDTGATTGFKWVAASAGGTPGGSSGQIQYNNSSSFGGASLLTTDASGLVLRIGPGTATNVSLDVAGNFRTVPFSLSDGANISLDPTRSNLFLITLGGNRTLMNPSNANMIQGLKFTIIVSQDATGSRKLLFDTRYRFGTDVSTYDASTTATTNDYITFWIRNAQSIDVVGISKGYR